jgi:hypothetical protein
MSTHSSKAKSRQVKITTIRKLFFCIFDKTMQAKNKVKQNKNKVKIVRVRLPLQKSSFSPAMVPEKVHDAGR